MDRHETESTQDAPRSSFIWIGMNDETEQFVNDFLIFILSRSVIHIPRQFRAGLHAA